MPFRVQGITVSTTSGFETQSISSAEIAEGERIKAIIEWPLVSVYFWLYRRLRFSAIATYLQVG